MVAEDYALGRRQVPAQTAPLRRRHRRGDRHPHGAAAYAEVHLRGPREKRSR
jgi:hypothetical protein